MTINSENFGNRFQILRDLGKQAVRDDLAIALPLVPRPEKADFDSAHFTVLRGPPFFLRPTNSAMPRPASTRASPTHSPG